MDEEQRETETEEQAGENWLAGATLEAGAEGVTGDNVLLALNDIGLSESDLPDDESGTALA